MIGFSRYTRISNMIPNTFDEAQLIVQCSMCSKRHCVTQLCIVNSTYMYIHICMQYAVCISNIKQRKCYFSLFPDMANGVFSANVLSNEITTYDCLHIVQILNVNRILNGFCTETTLIFGKVSSITFRMRWTYSILRWFFLLPFLGLSRNLS